MIDQEVFSMNFKVILANLLVVLMLASVAFASANEIATVMPCNLTMAKGMIIKVRAVDTISSQKIRQNEEVHFKVVQDIMIGDVVIVSANTDVEALITKIKKAGPWDKDGEIEVAFSEVKTKDGRSIPVIGMLQVHGNKPQFLIRYSLLGVLVKGKEAVIRAGTEVDLKIKEEVVIRMDKNDLKPEFYCPEATAKTF